MTKPKKKLHAKKHAAPHRAEAEAELHGLKKQLAAANDKLLRALAEAENVRRRAEREVKDAASYAVTQFARDMVGVLDNLERALKAVLPDLADDPNFKQFIEGVRLTERELLAAFERHGIKRITSKGEPFDHNRHQALFEVETESHPKGHVAEVVQEGYQIKDRLLRAALVGVAKEKLPPPAKRKDEEPKAGNG
jgi:molecular chaperone GrpE